MPQQWQQRPKTRLIQNDHSITTSELCAAYGPENQQLWPSSESFATGKLMQHGYQKMLKTVQKHLRTSTMWREKHGCFSAKNNYQWWRIGSSIWPTDEKENHRNCIISCRNTRKKFMVATSLGKVMSGTTKVSLLVGFLETGATINLEQLMQTFKNLKQWIWRLWPNRKMNQSLLLHDNKPHTSLHTREANCNSGVNCSPSSTLRSWFSTLQLPTFLGLWRMCSKDTVLWKASRT